VRGDLASGRIPTVVSKPIRRWSRFRTTLHRFVFRARQLFTSAYAATALIAFAFGATFAAILTAGQGRPDWNLVLVVITGVYVCLTYLLVKTSLRQAAAAETNADLFRRQMYSESRRRTGPLLVLVKDIRSRVSDWEQVTRNCDLPDLTDLPALLPDTIDEDLSRAATVDIYYHQQLSRAVEELRRVTEHVARVGIDHDEELLRQIKINLEFAREHLRSIEASAYGWDEEEE